MDALLEQLDDHIRRVVAEEVARDASAARAPLQTDALDEETRRLISEQTLLAHKTYLTRAEAAKYLGVSERSISEWSARQADQNPFPVAYAGGEPVTSARPWTNGPSQRRGARG